MSPDGAPNGVGPPADQWAADAAARVEARASDEGEHVMGPSGRCWAARQPAQPPPRCVAKSKRLWISRLESSSTPTQRKDTRSCGLACGVCCSHRFVIDQHGMLVQRKGIRGSGLRQVNRRDGRARHRFGNWFRPMPVPGLKQGRRHFVDGRTPVQPPCSPAADARGQSGRLVEIVSRWACIAFVLQADVFLIRDIAEFAREAEAKKSREPGPDQRTVTCPRARRGLSRGGPACPCHTIAGSSALGLTEPRPCQLFPIEQPPARPRRPRPYSAALLSRV